MYFMSTVFGSGEAALMPSFWSSTLACLPAFCVFTFLIKLMLIQSHRWNDLFMLISIDLGHASLALEYGKPTPMLEILLDQL